MDLKYSCGDMKVVELVMDQSKWLVCPTASELILFSESYMLSLLVSMDEGVLNM